MNRRRIATVTLVATTAAMLPAAASIAADTGGGSSVLVGSGRVITGPGQSPVLRQGDAAAGTSMSLSLLVPLPNQAEAQSLAAKGVVLSPAEYTRRFGASQAAVDKAAAWAKANGYRVTYVSRDAGQVFVTSTVGTVNKSLSVRIERAKLGAVSGLAPNTDPTIAKSSGVIAVAGLSTLAKKEPLNARGLNATRSALRTSKASAKVTPSANGATDGSANCAYYWGDHLYPKAKKYGVMSNAICGYIPQDLQKIYGSAPVSAQKPTLGILLWGNDKSILAQTNAYMKDAGFPQLAAANYKVFSAGKKIPVECDPLGVNVEQALDVQSTHAIAPNATIHYYDAGSCEDAPLTATLQKMVTAHQVTTISMSFGTGSDRGETAATKAAWDRPMLQASLTGISTFASSGDSGNNTTLPISETKVQGYAGVGLPASSNYTTAVGGTAIGLTAKGVQTVAAGWENRFFRQPKTSTTTGITDLTFTAKFLPVKGAGGGQSASYAQPSWQKGKVGSYTRRAVPDVSALADPGTGYTIRFLDMNNGNQPVYASVGGTSLASPIVAAMVGLAKKKNNSKVGLAAPIFYKLAGTSAIKDINYPGKSGVFYNAHNAAGQVVPNQGYVVGLDAKPENLVSGPRWDNVTGVGTPNGAAFFSAFK
ncbi:S8 family serine peptidase [Branchiibius sp. NY16-3462-2]|uniref:S53 family peptidase n=1 Tax=Branchiibius sp. NY16-3462-2 TaxID=1807500 RepID=UPI00079A34FE|nr:S53 family peptidase [Branchiibius sp. NY16-3462-2]KYH45043.1 hypothetical protein AZH51_14245 [Branchiibius sp. NY16-3462-2]